MCPPCFLGRFCLYWKQHAFEHGKRANLRATRGAGVEAKCERLPGGTPVFTTREHPITTDSLLLAEFCGVKRDWAACDLGSGGGVLLLCLVDAGLEGPAVGVEIQPTGTALLQRAIDAAALGHVQAVCGDIRSWRAERPLDLVVANPPYFTAGMTSPRPARAMARHQTAGDLADFCAAAARNLKDGGRFCLCYPADQLAAVFGEARAQRLEPKRLCLVRKAADAAPWLALVDVRKAAGVGLRILPDRIVPPGNSVRY